MIHGLGARKESWDKVADSLKSDFTCISYDLRGHGESPLGPGEFTLDDLVSDLESLRSRLGIVQAHFIGHSLGGMIGPAYARGYPERVLSLGMISTAAFRSPDDSAALRGVVAAMKEKGIAPVLDTMLDRWFSDAYARERPEMIVSRRKEALGTDPGVFLNVFRIYAETEMAPWLDQIQVPVLVCTGEFDGACNPGLNRKIAAALPDSELVILNDLKHSVLVEAPELIAAHAGDFLRKRNVIHQTFAATSLTRPD
jgi:pimeloyl-ACP methyl ester carboxylesterase